MSITPIFKEVDLALDALLRGDADDALARAEARGFLDSFVIALEQASERAVRFHRAGLVSEAFSVVKDFPELTQQLHDWQQLLAKPGAKSDLARELHPASVQGVSQELIDDLQQVVFEHADLDAELRSLRRASLEQESVQKLRARYESLTKRARGTQTWVEQLERVEREWIEFMRRGLESGISDDEIAAFASEWFRGGWVVRLDNELSSAIKARWDVVRQRLADQRYAALAKVLQSAFASGDREGIERVEHDWAAVNHDTGRMPSPQVAAAADPAFQWAEAERARLALEASHQAARDELEHLLDSGASAADVLRAWTRIGDDNVPIPDGLHERASRYLETHRVTEKRKFALKGVAALAAVLVLGAMVFWGWQTWERRNLLLDQLAALESTLDQRLSEGVVETAEALLAGLGEGDSRAVQLLERAKALKLEHDSMAASAAELEAEVDAAIGQADDAQAAQFKGRAEALLADKRLEGSVGTKAKLDAIRSKCDGRQAQLVSLAAAKAAEAESSLSAFRTTWPKPEAWTRELYISVERWKSYIKALEDQRVAFDALITGVSAHEAARKRIEVCSREMASSLEDARSKLDTLQRVLDSLRPESLGRECTREADFINRITALLDGDSGVFLEKLGFHGDFSGVIEREAGWAALQAWRESLQARLLGVCPDPTKFGKDAACDGLPDELAKVIAQSQRSPMLVRLKELQASINGLAAAAAQEEWDSTLEAARMDAMNLTPMKIRAMTDGRWLRARPGLSGKPGFYLLEMIDFDEAGDKPLLSKDPRTPDNVETEFFPKSGNGGASTPGASPAKVLENCPTFVGSKVWDALIEQLKVAGEGQYLDALSTAARSLHRLDPDPRKGGDPQVQARMLVTVVRLLLECGQALSDQAKEELQDWIDRAVGDRASAKTRVLLANDGAINWLADSFESAAQAQETTSECLAVIGRFPVKVLDDLKARGPQFSVIKEVYVPVGVLMHGGDAASAGRRVVIWRSGVEPWVVAGEGPAARLVGLTTTKGQDGPSCQKVPAGVPSGPVLVFERRVRK